MKPLKYTREYFLKFLKDHNIAYLKDLSANHPHLALYYARHRHIIGDLPLLYSKNNFWTKESCAFEAKKFMHRVDFQRGNKAAYVKAVKSGWLNDICAHMVPKMTRPNSPNKGKPALNRKDLTGQTKYGWTILEYAYTKNKEIYWKCRCLCGRLETVRGGNIKQGKSQKCSKCNNQISRASVDIHKFILNLGITDAILSHRGFGREIDVYVPSKRFAIEIDGIRWHSELFRATEDKELQRYKWFKDNGITCLRIFDDEFKKSSQLIYRMIKARLLPQEKIKSDYVIKFIPNPSQYQQFFETNHLDGYANSKFAFGAFDKEGTLISCASFRHYMRGKHKGQLEVARFCSDSTKPTYGCFGSLMKAAKEYARVHGYTHILSASDNRLGNGLVYANNGFKQVEGLDNRLNYYYYVPSKNEKLHRSSVRKLHPPKIDVGTYEKYPTQAAQNEAGLFGLLRYGVHEKFYKVWGWGNKLWVLEL